MLRTLLPPFDAAEFWNYTYQGVLTGVATLAGVLYAAAWARRQERWRITTQRASDRTYDWLERTLIAARRSRQILVAMDRAIFDTMRIDEGMSASEEIRRYADELQPLLQQLTLRDLYTGGDVLVRLGASYNELAVLHAHAARLGLRAPTSEELRASVMAFNSPLRSGYATIDDLSALLLSEARARLDADRAGHNIVTHATPKKAVE
jgi:hypothetical protein